LPQRTTLEVVETEPVTKGQTASSSYKPAILSNGVLSAVPPHIGVGIFVVMNYLVVPLSEIGRLPQFTAWTFGGNLVAMLGFGLMIAFFARGSLSG